MKFANANKLPRKSGGLGLCRLGNKTCIEEFLTRRAAEKAFALKFLPCWDISDNQVRRFSAKGNRVDDSTPHPCRSAKSRSARFIELLFEEASYFIIDGQP
jgi:hypothetical protein